MTDNPVFNEPGYEQHFGTEYGDTTNEGYCNIIR